MDVMIVDDEAAARILRSRCAAEPILMSSANWPSAQS
jgi:hypothetical protein